MRYRLIFLAIVAFFLTMNVLLWRSEFASRNRFSAPVPPGVVWEKLVTSPDDSWLEIRHHGVRIGRAQWLATIKEEFPREDEFSEDLPPEGMVHRVTGYTLDFDGWVSLDELTRLRFNLGLRLDTNQVWTDLSVKVVVKPFSLALDASSLREELRVTVEDETRKEYVYPFSQLRTPDKLLRDLGGPLLPAALGAFSLPLRNGQSVDGQGGFAWEARHDRLQLGRADLRVYRLEATAFGRYKATLLVSPVGEVLRIELPDDIIMTNEALTSL
jgi:hypothetical protein